MTETTNTLNVLPTKSRLTLDNAEANPNVGPTDVLYLIDHNDGLRIISASEKVPEFTVGAEVKVRHAKADFIIGGVKILAEKFLTNGKLTKDDTVHEDELGRRLAHWKVQA